MKKTLIIVAFSFVLLQTAAQNILDVKITQIEEVEGTIQICLYDTEDNYMYSSRAFACPTGEVLSKIFEFSFESLPDGTYAIVAFQDLNDNKNLDTNWMRIPKEPYGFSNNPSTTFGPPSFKGASFSVETDKSIEIKLR